MRNGCMSLDPHDVSLSSELSSVLHAIRLTERHI
jgi:hypothetical protein